MGLPSVHPQKRSLNKLIIFILMLLAGFGLWRHFAASGFDQPPDDPDYRKIVNHFRAAQPIPVSVSPDGKYLLAKTEENGGFKIAVLDRDRKREIALEFSKCSQLSLTWRPDSQAIAFQEVSGLNRPLFVLDLQLGEKKQVGAPISQTSTPPLRWSPSGRRLAYFEGDYRTGRLLVVNPEQDIQPTIVQASMSSSCDFVWSPDGTRIAASTGTDGVITITTLHDLEQKRVRVVDGEIQALAWSPDGNSLLATACGLEDEFFKLFQVDVKTGAVSLKAQADGDIRQPIWVPDSKAFIYHVNSNGITRAFLADADGVKPIGPTNGVLHLSHLDPDGKSIYGHFSGLTTPPVLGRIALGDGNWAVLYSCPASEKCRCPEPACITIKSKEGPGVPAYHWPAVPHIGAEPAALIVVHGGLHTQTYPAWEAYIQLATELGCDVLAENHRGSSGYGRNYENLRGDPADDIIATCKYAENVLGIKPRRIYLIGLSIGTRLIGEAISRGGEFGGVFLISWPGAKPPANPHFRHSFPIWEFHGEIDAVLSPYAAQRSMKRFFNGSPFKIDYHVFEGEGHFFYRAETSAAIYWELSKALQH